MTASTTTDSPANSYGPGFDRPVGLQPNGFHQRHFSWGKVAIAFAIPLVVAGVTAGFSFVRTSWHSKADASEVRTAIARSDSINTSNYQQLKQAVEAVDLRVRQIQCGRRVDEGCR